MADILKIALLIIGAMLIYVSHWLLAQGLFPKFVEQTNKEYARPVKLTFVGLAIYVPLLVLGLVVANLPNPAIKIFGIVLISAPAMLGLIGSAGLCQRIGAGLHSSIDEQQPWRRVLRGGIVLVLTFLLPFAGWFFIQPWTLVSGCGAAVLAILRQRKASTPETPALMPTQAAA